MRKRIINLSKLFLMSFVCVGLFASDPHAFAATTSDLPQTTQDMSTVPVLSAKDIVANTGVYNTTIQSQNANEFVLGFDITNRGAAQSNVFYTVNLFKKDKNLAPFDQKVYAEDMLNFGAGETIHKEVRYTAPASFNGVYTIEIQIKNADGLALGANRSAEFSLNGNGENISIDTPTCFVVIDGKEGRYTLSQGVDVSKEETLIAHCSLRNNFTKDMFVVPVIETHYRSSVGKIMSTEKGAIITLEPGKATHFSAKLPKMTEPQAYTALIILTDTSGSPVSSSVDFHYVLQGQSATIQNFMLDKDYYSKGETATATLIWTGAADNFPEARNQTIATASDTTIALSVVDDQSKSCIGDFSQPADMNQNRGKESIALPITADCKNPMATVKILGADGKVLAENTYAIESKSLNTSDNALFPAMPTKNMSRILIYGGIFLLVVLLAVFFIKRKPKSYMRMLLGLLMGYGVLVSGGHAKAETYSTPIWWSIINGAGAGSQCGAYGAGWGCSTGQGGVANAGLTVDIDSSTRSYAPGSALTVIGTSNAASCLNSFGSKLTATVNGVTKAVTDGAFSLDTPSGWHQDFHFSSVPSPSFTVSNTPGTYDVTFTLYQYVLNYDMFGPCSSWIQTSSGGPKLCGNTSGTAKYAIATANISYTVTAPVVVTPPVVVNAAPNTPTIAGPIAGSAGADQSFMLTATDSETDQLKYEVDWDMNGSADVTVPSAGLVASGTSQSVLKNWPAIGTYTFQVRAVDSKSSASPWTSHTIVIGTAPSEPVIVGPILGNTLAEHFFTITSTDPDADQLKYEVDWDMDNSMIIPVPSSDLIASGVSQTISRSWLSAGIYGFQARAIDSNGNASSWKSHSITIQCPTGQTDDAGVCKCTNTSLTLNPLTNACEANPNVCDPGFDTNPSSGKCEETCLGGDTVWAPDTSTKCPFQSVQQTKCVSGFVQRMSSLGSNSSLSCSVQWQEVIQ